MAVQSIAEAEQRAEAERKKRRAELQSQIDQWNVKVSEVNNQISELSSDQKKLNICLTDWTRQKNIYNNNAVLSSVVIVNVFEGVCADKIKDDLTASVSQMDRTYNDVSGLSMNVSEQINKLRQYISVINRRLMALHSELNSI